MSRRTFSRSELLVVLAILVVLGVFPLALINASLQPEGQAWARPFGRRQPIDWEIARFLFGGIGLGALILVLAGMWKVARDFLRTSAKPQLALEIGEPIRWQGRPGVKGLTSAHASVAGLVLLGPLPLALAMWWACSSTSFTAMPMLFQAAFGGALLLTLGPIAFGPAFMVLTKENRWLCELAGEVVVTDRRILWTTPFGGIAQELRRGDLLDVRLIEEREGRGWIELARRRGKLNRTLHDMRGVPGPTAAMSAMSWLIA